MFLNFLSMKILFRAYFNQKNFQKKVGRKFIRVRIRNRIRTFSKVGSGQKSSGSATLLFIMNCGVRSPVFRSLKNDWNLIYTDWATGMLQRNLSCKKKYCTIQYVPRDFIPYFWSPQWRNP
jgi:hypothetical protein